MQLLDLPSLQALLCEAPPASGASCANRLGWAAGRTRIFLKQGQFGVLWWARAQRRLTATTRLQTACRRLLAQRTARRRSCAIATIQRHARGAAVREEVRRLRRARAATQQEASLCEALQAAEEHVPQPSGDADGRNERAGRSGKVLQATTTRQLLPTIRCTTLEWRAQ